MGKWCEEARLNGTELNFEACHIGKALTNCYFLHKSSADEEHTESRNYRLLDTLPAPSWRKSDYT